MERIYKYLVLAFRFSCFFLTVYNGNAWDLYSGGALLKSQPNEQLPWQGFYSFPESLQAIDRIVPQLGHGHFLPDPL
jgi:hypothetical protein